MATAKDRYYSPLCDTDQGAYFAFILRSFYDGSVPERASVGYDVVDDVSSRSGDSFDALYRGFAQAHRRLAGCVRAVDSDALHSEDVHVGGLAHTRCSRALDGDNVGIVDDNSCCCRGLQHGGVGPTDGDELKRKLLEGAVETTGVKEDETVWVRAKEELLSVGGEGARGDISSPGSVASEIELKKRMLWDAVEAADVKRVEAICARVKEGLSLADGESAHGGVSSFGSVVSEKTLANREKRAKKKERKLRKQQVGHKAFGDDEGIPEWRRGARPNYRGAFESCSEEVRKKLADTRARRLIAENEASVREAEAKVEGWTVLQKTRRKRASLQLVKTEQELELVRSRDVEQLKRRQETRVMRDTETNKVAVERAFGTLAATGNAVGTVQTIVGSGSISPNSSVSAAEVRKMHKEILDLKKQNTDLVERLRGCKVGVNDDVPYSVGITVDEEGHPIGDFGDGYGGYIGTDGRFHTGINWAEYY